MCGDSFGPFNCYPSYSLRRTEEIHENPVSAAGPLVKIVQCFFISKSVKTHPDIV
jgi:hypothetical protein